MQTREQMNPWSSGDSSCLEAVDLQHPLEVTDEEGIGVTTMERQSWRLRCKPSISKVQGTRGKRVSPPCHPRVANLMDGSPRCRSGDNYVVRDAGGLQTLGYRGSRSEDEDRKRGWSAIQWIRNAFGLEHLRWPWSCFRSQQEATRWIGATIPSSERALQVLSWHNGSSTERRG